MYTTLHKHNNSSRQYSKWRPPIMHTSHSQSELSMKLAQLFYIYGSGWEYFESQWLCMISCSSSPFDQCWRHCVFMLSMHLFVRPSTCASLWTQCFANHLVEFHHIYNSGEPGAVMNWLDFEVTQKVKQKKSQLYQIWCLENPFCHRRTLNDDSLNWCFAVLGKMRLKGQKGHKWTKYCQKGGRHVHWWLPFEFCLVCHCRLLTTTTLLCFHFICEILCCISVLFLFYNLFIYPAYVVI